jgi:hypothetical protein
MRNIKGTMITTTLLTFFLLLVTPIIPAIQYSTVLDTNTSGSIQPLPRIIISELKEKRKTFDCTTFTQTIKNNTLNEMIQQLKEVLKNELSIISERLLCFLILCVILADTITYKIGISLGPFIDFILYSITKGKWELFTITNLIIIPSDIFDSIIDALYELGMKWYGWPYPWSIPPGYH